MPRKTDPDGVAAATRNIVDGVRNSLGGAVLGTIKPPALTISLAKLTVPLKPSLVCFCVAEYVPCCSVRPDGVA